MSHGSSKPRAQVRPAGKVVRRDGTVTHVRYSQRIARKICERLAGGEIWHRICNTGGLPSYDTLYKWVRKHPDFAEAYAQAREMAADMRADRVLVVAEASTPATVQSDRLKVGAYQWHSGKALPKRYGSRAGEDDKPAPEAATRRLIVEVRRFEVAHDADGVAFTREILPQSQPAEALKLAGRGTPGERRR